MFDQITIFGIISLINCLTCIFIGTFLLIKSKKNPINICYCIFDYCIALYAFFYFLWQSSSQREWGISFFKWCIFGVVLINSAFVHFTYVILDLQKRHRNQLILVHTINAFFCYAALLLFYDQWVIKYSYGLWPIPTTTFHVYISWWFLQVIYCFYLIYTKGIQTTSGKQKEQYQWIFWATLIAYTGGATNWLVWYNIKFPPYLNSGIAVYTAVLAFAIFRYQILGIEVFIRKTLVSTGLASFAFGVYVLSTFVTQELLSAYIGVNRWLSLFVTAFIIVLGFDPLKKLLNHLTENILFQKDIDYDQVDRDISDQIQITELSTQLRNVVNIFSNGFSLDAGAIFLYNEEKKIFRLAHRTGKTDRPQAVDIDAADESILFLTQHRGNVLTKDSLIRENSKSLVKFFSDWRAEVACKITFKNSVIAILLLGKKKSDRDFTQKDIDFLDRVSKNLGVSINNALTFKFKENYYVLMAEKNKTDVLGRLSEGIDHEIKNPLNAIKPAAQRVQGMIQKGPSPLMTAKINEYLEMIVRNVDRIVTIMTRLRNYAKPMRDSKDFKLEPVKLKDFVEEAIELVSRKQLEVDGIKVENKIDDNIYIFGERSSIEQVFWNLICNAHHAINRKGKISISSHDSEGDGKVVVEVSDTGKGIVPENMDKIFNPFFTTKPTNLPPDGTERFTGTGLGLCYVKQYVESLGGSITCDSKVGEGTTFFIKFLKAGNDAKEN